MKLLNLRSLETRKLIERFLKLRHHSLSSYSYINIFIWQDFFKFYYEIINGKFCIFAKNNIGIFMYLPPLGKDLNKETIHEIFQIMNSSNENKDVSRIENIERDDLNFYKDLGLRAYLKSKDYIYHTRDLIYLRGNRFKSKRALCNYFKKNYKYSFLKYEKQYHDDCLRLVKSWEESRVKKNNDVIYTAMLEQSGFAFKCLLKNLKFLGAEGFLVSVGGEIKACSFGYKLNKETFCIIFEIADLDIKGISQFIFREFCKQKDKFRYINAMDDSGLENLKNVKLSYRPCGLEESYCVKCIEK